jgi:hypothetical protein
VCARNNPDHPTWQRCGSHRGQSKSRFTLSKVNKMLTLIGRTQSLSDVTDARMHRQACKAVHIRKKESARTNKTKQNRDQKT